MMTYQLLELLLAHTPDVVFFKDRNSRYIECNETLLQLAGVPREILLGNDTSTFLPPPVTERILREDKAVMDSGKPMRFEQWVEFPDGKLALMDTVIAPIINEHGDPIGLLGIGRDITELMNTSIELQEKNRELEKANHELDALMYHAAHDLRAPLTSMLGLINIMRQEDDPVKLQRLFDMQDTHIKKMDDFIQNIVNLSKNTRVGIQVQEVYLEKMFFEIIEQFKFLQGAAVMKFEYQGKGLPVLYNDAFRIQLVLGNLISNAIRYHDPQKQQPKLVMHAEILPDKAILRLEDNGIGMEAIHLDHIFEMFYRASKSSKGSGIGLYITLETLQKIGGTIRVESEPGIGSTFIVDLPNYRL